MLRLVGRNMRYFADSTLGLDVIKKALSGEDPLFKIDGGEVTRGGELLAEIELTKPGSDMFSDDLDGMLRGLHHVGASDLVARVERTQAVLAVQVNDSVGDVMNQLEPLWTVLSRMSTGLWHLDGQGIYDNGRLVARV